MDPIVVNKVSMTYRIKRGSSLKYLFSREELRALEEVSLKVKQGEIFGLIGPSGAGKTTLVRILATLQIPSAGTVLINGKDVVKEYRPIQRDIGVVLGERSRALYWRISGRKNLEFFAALYDLRGDQAKERIAWVLEKVGLTNKADELVMNYSTGMRNKLGIARTLLHNPSILLFDELSTGMDPLSAMKVRNLIKELCHKDKKTIFLTSHNMEEIDLLCDRVALINKGSVIAMDTTKKLKKMISKDELIKIVLNKPLFEVEKIKQLKGISHVRANVTHLTIHAQRGIDIGMITETIEKQHRKILSLNTIEPSMEEVFMKLMENNNE